ncbi:MAG: 50S ribosomal protein L11 methyltransferase [[Eubacterium] sulci]|mgnify:FL=1|jgi:ribosomal protein L11 methyltransferase|nr:50S ribosomal protein L11 methyltransferase [[Eubacterium] sulci]MBF1171537.1 50S ribosomal protein L11 methyltransferase [[Eubacterium] sulci]MBF1177382.1 50S ribosomal protein L11 methyltransferase [[Eubacterium] sulci]
MKYIEVKIKTSKSGIDPVLAALMNIGINDAMIDDPDEILAMIASPGPSEWYDESQIPDLSMIEPAVTVFFADDEEGRSKSNDVRKAIEELAKSVAEGRYGAEADLGELSVSAKVEDDVLWRDKWKEYFKPTKLSNNIVVKPTWCEYEPNEEDIVIEIDPGMAFGTGTHETTMLCIRMIEKYMHGGYKVLDVGSGSGILSIAAAKLGASDVLGIDIDEDAVRVSNENYELNKVSDRAKAIVGDLTAGVDYKANIVVANLLADIVMRLSKDAKRHLGEKGIFITSGILTEKSEAVEKCMIECGFEIVEKAILGEWCSIVAVNKAV